MLVISFLGWSRFAGVRLQDAIDEITATGEPLFPSDFNSPPIPEQDNAAVLYEKAARLITEGGVHESPVLKKCRELSIEDDGFVSTCGALVASQQAPLSLVREARKRPNVSWSIKFQSPLLDYALPKLSGSRAAAKLLAIKMRLEHLNQDDKEVVENINDMLALSAALDQHPTTISHLVAVSIEALVLDAIESMGSDLVIRSVDDSDIDQAANRETVERIIDHLLDDVGLRAGLKRAFQNERAIQLDVVLGLSGGSAATKGSGAFGNKYSRGWTAIPLVPLFKQDGVALLEHMGYLLKAIESQTRVDYKNYLKTIPTPPWERATTRWQQIKHIASQTIYPSLDRAVELQYRVLALRRMGATALAIRLYELDHGHRPATLEALVPDYLPAVPVDAMSDGRVIGYLPDAEFPRLYSVGSNGLDDGGEFAFGRYGKIDKDALDVPFFLDGPPPLPKIP